MRQNAHNSGSLARSDSIRSPRSRRRRTGSILRKRPVKEVYHCFAGQIHIKSFLLGIQVCFLIIGCAGLVITSFPDPLPTNINGTIVQEKIVAYRGLISAYSMLFVFSSLTCALGVRLMRRTATKENDVEKKCRLAICNPSLFLAPLLISEIVLMIPFAMWAASIVRAYANSFSAAEPTSVVLSILDMLRYIVIPIIVVWATLCYVIYNTFVCYVCIWRQSGRGVRFSQTLFSISNGEPTVNCSIQDFPPTSSAFVKRSPTSPWRKTQRNSLDTAHARKLRNLRDLNVSLDSIDETIEGNTDTKLLSPSKSSGRLNASFSSLNILPTLLEGLEKEPSPSPKAFDDQPEETIELRRLNTTIEEEEK